MKQIDLGASNSYDAETYLDWFDWFRADHFTTYIKYFTTSKTTLSRPVITDVLLQLDWLWGFVTPYPVKISKLVHSLSMSVCVYVLYCYINMQKYINIIVEYGQTHQAGKVLFKMILRIFLLLQLLKCCKKPSWYQCSYFKCPSIHVFVGTMFVCLLAQLRYRVFVMNPCFLFRQTLSDSWTFFKRKMMSTQHLFYFIPVNSISYPFCLFMHHIQK